MTIVFADVTGSTGLGERLDPESLRHVMQRYFDEMRAVLESHGGSVEKFIGDAVMAVFGIPQVHEDDSLRAVRAAADMRARLADLNSELESNWAVRLEMRVGVNTGEVVAGSAAVGQAFVTGDAVNVAARLEETAAPGDILLGEATYRLVRDAVSADALGEDLELRGKSGASRAWRLLEVRPGVPGRLRRVDAPMVGRERELALLRQAYERSAQEQTCHLFTVLGTAGIGKSRLVREFVSRLPGEVRVAQGRCLPYGEGITYWPVAEAVKELANIGEEQSTEEARARLAELASPESDAAAVAAKLASVLGLGEGSAATEEVFWALRRLLESQAGSGPLVVVFDDIQWGEETFLDLIEYLVDSSRDAPILVVCLARPELLDVRPGWAGGKLNATSVLLEQLPGDECSRLVENLLGEGELAEEARRRIADRAAGNPLFIEELLAMLLDEGVLERENGRWSVASDLEAVGVPGTIQALLAARLDRLPPDERARDRARSRRGRALSCGRRVRASRRGAGTPGESSRVWCERRSFGPRAGRSARRKRSDSGTCSSATRRTRGFRRGSVQISTPVSRTGSSGRPASEAPSTRRFSATTSSRRTGTGSSSAPRTRQPPPWPGGQHTGSERPAGEPRRGATCPPRRDCSSARRRSCRPGAPSASSSSSRWAGPCNRPESSPGPRSSSAR